MKKISTLLLLLILFVSVSCKNDKKVIEKNPETVEVKKIKVKLEAKSDSKVSGNIVFVEENGTVKMSAILQGLEPGNHAIHIHEKADCSAADGTSSGGHWNPTGQPHGKWGSPEGYHKGDIGNLTAEDTGFAALEFSTDEWCIGCGDATKDIVGKAVIVHAGTDDYGQPTGNAGGRISCGAVIK